MTGNSKTSDSRIIISREARNLCYSRRGTHVSPHMCCELLHFPHLSFIPLGTYPARFARHLFFPRRESCVLVSLSSQWGKAVLSLSALETHFPTLFHTASALSAPTGHLPLRGRLTIRGKPVIADFRASPHIYLRRSRHHKFESRLFLLPIYEAS